jgi:hypothetical protein
MAVSFTVGHLNISLHTQIKWLKVKREVMLSQDIFIWIYFRIELEELKHLIKSMLLI